MTTTIVVGNPKARSRTYATAVGVAERLTGWSGAEAIGRQIKLRIRERTGLHASVGMAANKLVAKLASELSKPDGFLRVRPEEVRALLDPLPVGRLWTVGKVAEEHLHRIGIRTIGELARCDPGRLQRALGRQVDGLQALARGEDDRPVCREVAEQSISAENTFDVDIADLAMADEGTYGDGEVARAALYHLHPPGPVADGRSCHAGYPPVGTTLAARLVDPAAASTAALVGCWAFRIWRTGAE